MERASASLDRAISHVLGRVPSKQSAVLAWPVACGSAVAARTQALSFEKGVLSVEVPDRGWRRELCALNTQYLAALNRLSAERIERIEFVVHK